MADELVIGATPSASSSSSNAPSAEASGHVASTPSDQTSTLILKRVPSQKSDPVVSPDGPQIVYCAETNDTRSQTKKKETNEDRSTGPEKQQTPPPATAERNDKEKYGYRSTGSKKRLTPPPANTERNNEEKYEHRSTGSEKRLTPPPATIERNNRRKFEASGHATPPAATTERNSWRKIEASATPPPATTERNNRRKIEASGHVKEPIGATPALRPRPPSAPPGPRPPTALPPASVGLFNDEMDHQKAKAVAERAAGDPRRLWLDQKREARKKRRGW